MREHIEAWPFVVRLGVVVTVGLVLFASLPALGFVPFFGLVVAACIFLFPGLTHRSDNPPNG